jgi:hypothetical protein
VVSVVEGGVAAWRLGGQSILLRLLAVEVATATAASWDVELGLDIARDKGLRREIGSVV